MIFKEQAPWFTIAHAVQLKPVRKEVVDFKLSPVRPPHLLRRRHQGVSVPATAAGRLAAPPCSRPSPSVFASYLRRAASMLRFILTRVSLVIPTFIGITLLAFFLIRLVPGDPIETMAGERGIDAGAARAAAQGIRPRPAGARAVRHLHRPRAARRPRQLDRHAGAGARRIPGAVPGDDRARRSARSCSRSCSACRPASSRRSGATRSSTTA